MEATVIDFSYQNFPYSKKNGYQLVNYQAYVQNIWLIKNNKDRRIPFLKKQPRFRPIYVLIGSFQTQEDSSCSDSDRESVESNDSETTKVDKEIIRELDDFLHSAPSNDNHVDTVINDIVLGEVQKNLSGIDINK